MLFFFPDRLFLVGVWCMVYMSMFSFSIWCEFYLPLVTFFFLYFLFRLNTEWKSMWTYWNSMKGRKKENTLSFNDFLESFHLILRLPIPSDVRGVLYTSRMLYLDVISLQLYSCYHCIEIGTQIQFKLLFFFIWFFVSCGKCSQFYDTNVCHLMEKASRSYH